LGHDKKCLGHDKKSKSGTQRFMKYNVLNR
jgi:hypothetical protein